MAAGLKTTPRQVNLLVEESHLFTVSAPLIGNFFFMWLIPGLQSKPILYILETCWSLACPAVLGKQAIFPLSKQPFLAVQARQRFSSFTLLQAKFHNKTDHQRRLVWLSYTALTFTLKKVLKKRRKNDVAKNKKFHD